MKGLACYLKRQHVPCSVQETLRFYPAGNPMYSPCRKCTKDTVLGGYKIPAGVGIMLNSVGYSQDAKYFPDPTVSCPLLLSQFKPRI